MRKLHVSRFLLFAAVAVFALLLPRVGIAGILLRIPLTLVAGEDPSLPNCDPLVLETCAVGDARVVDGPLFKLGLSNLDPSRFPAGPACSAEIRVGSIIDMRGVQLLPGIAPDGRPTTSLEIAQPGTVAAGDRAQVRIRCQFTNALGLVEKHETQWAGTF